ncbi:MAG: HipA domain-containing protein [Turicibacter sp.]|nr:HipA domain-containing protein [Turicibacter sp.]
MIDFDKGTELANRYGGSEVKTTILYENAVYMIKYPDPIRSKRNVLSYMNNQYSEHIGSQIFNACGIVAQETHLGYFTDVKGQRKIVVACKDFTEGVGRLHEVSRLVNQTQVDGKKGTTIESVQDVIKTHKLIANRQESWEKFWDMFVIDALIGNKDRHLDNWGFLEIKGELRFAPIYDCGSSLSALLADDKMAELLENPSALKSEEYNHASCYSLNGKRMLYHEIFKNPPIPLQNSIKRTVPKIDLGKISNIIDETPTLSDVRKEYLKSAISLRYEQILLPSFKKLSKENVRVATKTKPKKRNNHDR